MNPRLILTLWRERWDKADSGTPKVPYANGVLNEWSRRLATASVWALPGASIVVALLSCLILVLMLSVEFSLNSQIAFSVLIVSFALYARRFNGMLLTLTLIGLSLLVSTRYLYWRFTATLGQNFNQDFVFGFCLAAAELYLFILTSLRFVPLIWPVRQDYVPLPEETFSWPSVDVYIPCHDQSQSAILAATQAALALNWPHKKIHIYLLDDKHREEVNVLATSIGARYLTHPDHPDGRSGAINLTLPDTTGELIAIFDNDHLPGKDFLHLSVGWFMRDTSLGMLQTPQHFLAPAPSVLCTEIFSDPTLGGFCALIRRAMLVEVEGVESAPMTPQAHTALKLQAAGFGHAYIGFNEQTRVGSNPAALEAFRVVYPFSETTLRWKLRLPAFLATLQLYETVPHLIFLTAPVLYLLAGINLIQASGELFLAYALPHLIHHLIAQARMQGRTRFTSWSTVRETTLAWYMWVRTAMTLIHTEWSRRVKPFRADKPGKVIPVDWHTALPYACILILNLAGFAMGSARFLGLSPQAQETSMLYLLWSAYNFLTLAGMMAVAQETQHIRQHIRTQRRVSAMIRLPSGKSVMCRTENFPATALELKLPAPVVIEAGSLVRLSIFHGRQEFDFLSRVLDLKETTLRVSIEDDALKNYDALGAAIQSRGDNWPKWLPDRDADHPLPPWVTQPVVRLYVRSRALGSYSISWIQKWKKKND